MSAATASPAQDVAFVERGLVAPRPGYDEYEVDVDVTACLHLPADECDHHVFRCCRCCEHPA